MKTIITLFLILFHICSIHAKVRIFTFHYNIPELIIIQDHCLKKYIKDDYELIVFNDARDPEIAKKIEDICLQQKIKHKRFPQLFHAYHPDNEIFKAWDKIPGINSHIGLLQFPENHPSLRHCHVIEYAMEKYGYDHNDVVVIMDGDCFPTRPVSFKQILGSDDICAIKRFQGDIVYPWVVLTIFDPIKMPNHEDFHFYVDIVDNWIHDTGSHMYHYLRDNPGIKYSLIDGQASSGFYHWDDKNLIAWGFNKKEIRLIRDLSLVRTDDPNWRCNVEFHMEKCFIHLGNSSFDLQGQNDKIECIKNFIFNNL